MSVLDIFPVDPDYPVAVDILDGVLRQQSHDGRQFARPLRADRRQFRLEFHSRPTTELQQIIAWSRRFRDQVFLLHHKVWERGSWNILGIDAEAEHITGDLYNFNRFKTPGAVTLTDLGLKVGDILSFGGEARVDNAADSLWYRLAFLDIDEAELSFQNSPTTSSLTYVEVKKENATIPANTIALVLRGNFSGTADNHYFRKAKLNRGATFAEFEAPFTNQEYVPRFFPVRFAAPVRHRLAAHESHDIEVDLIEAVGATLDEVHHPDPLDLSLNGNFLEETEATVLSGAWTDAIHDDAHGRTNKTNPNTNDTDELVWNYSGYGFRLWARKNPGWGEVEVIFDGVSLGNVDLVAGSATVSAPVLTKLDVPLGLHTVKLKTTGDSSQIVADAIEYMP